MNDEPITAWLHSTPTRQTNRRARIVARLRDDALEARLRRAAFGPDSCAPFLPAASGSHPQVGEFSRTVSNISDPGKA